MSSARKAIVTIAILWVLVIVGGRDSHASLVRPGLPGPRRGAAASASPSL